MKSFRLARRTTNFTFPFPKTHEIHAFLFWELTRATNFMLSSGGACLREIFPESREP